MEDVALAMHSLMPTQQKHFRVEGWEEEAPCICERDGARVSTLNELTQTHIIESEVRLDIHGSLQVC